MKNLGLDSLENRLLKKALLFTQHYIHYFKFRESSEYFTQILNFIIPAFDSISDEVKLNEIKHTKINSFFKEYDEGIRLAKLILKRFGYNINNTNSITIRTSPFWIDMSKLFELYVLGLLKDRFSEAIMYQQGNSVQGYVDYILNSSDYKMIIDAKYKLVYSANERLEDIRQISGYARNRYFLSKLGYTSIEEQDNTVADCLIIYPNKSASINLPLEFKTSETMVDNYTRFYKIGIRLPEVK